MAVVKCINGKFLKSNDSICIGGKQVHVGDKVSESDVVTSGLDPKWDYVWSNEKANVAYLRSLVFKKKLDFYHLATEGGGYIAMAGKEIAVKTAVYVNVMKYIYAVIKPAIPSNYNYWQVPVEIAERQQGTISLWIEGYETLISWDKGKFDERDVNGEVSADWFKPVAIDPRIAGVSDMHKLAECIRFLINTADGLWSPKGDCKGKYMLSQISIWYPTDDNGNPLDEPEDFNSYKPYVGIKFPSENSFYYFDYDDDKVAFNGQCAVFLLM